MRPAFLALPLLLTSLIAVPAGAAPLSKKEFNTLKKKAKIGLAKGAPDLLVEGLAGMAEDDSKRAVDFILKVAMGAQQHQAKVYAAAGESLAKMTSKEATSALCAHLTKKRSPPLIKILVSEALAGRDDASSAQALGDALKDGRPQVMRALLKAIKARRSGECVPGLLDLLERLEKRPDALIKTATQEALVEITGKWFDSMEDWRKWWSYSKHSGKRPVTGDSKALLASHARGKKPPTFFGSEIRSERIVFVIDVSGSMEGDRLAKCKKQLTQCISGLRPGSSFTIAAYSNQVRSWNAKLQPANQRNKGKAMSFVEGLRASGNTHTLEALQRGLEVGNADTIVLLSDGAPTQKKKNGEDWTMPEILDELVAANKAKQRQIHTFGFTAAGQNLVKFMKDIAKAHDGKFTPID